jgi:hypothetical protein
VTNVLGAIETKTRSGVRLLDRWPPLAGQTGTIAELAQMGTYRRARRATISAGSLERSAPARAEAMRITDDKRGL